MLGLEATTGRCFIIDLESDDFDGCDVRNNNRKM